MLRADLHIHSRYSRATSREADLERMACWANRKGIQVLGTGDCTHPAWREELRAQLIPAEPGLYRLAPGLEPPPLPGSPPTRFLVTTEIATIHRREGATRRIHHLVGLPSLEAAERLAATLGRWGNLAADGRPMLGVDSRDLLEMVLQSDPHAWLIPAHIWTPWYALLGARSGFDSPAACYRDLTGHLLALETGLSSDPPMNWRVSALDPFRLVSFSDAHSPANIGREATLFHTPLDYFALERALRTGDGYGGTIEFHPQEGKYYWEGHRACGVALPPAPGQPAGRPCPACRRPLTDGVLRRVEELADRPAGIRPPTAGPWVRVVPLPQVVGEVLGVGAGSKRVNAACTALHQVVGAELECLLEAPLELLERHGPPRLAEAIEALRRGRVAVAEGYDGRYGTVRLLESRER